MEPTIGLEPMTCRFQIGSLDHLQRGIALVIPNRASSSVRNLLLAPMDWTPFPLRAILAPRKCLAFPPANV
jgi:hypothetical protein